MGRAISFRGRTALVLAATTILVAATAATAAARVAPVNTSPPAISGTPRVGQTLSATQGQWQGSPTSFFYQWLRCDGGNGNCTAVNGAVQPTYGLTAADVGKRIRVEVVAQNADGASPAARSAATNAIRIQAPRLSAKPEINGVAREGQTLTATTGTWTGSPSSFEYQWKRCTGGPCVAVPGATESTYLLSGADVGTRIRVRVTAANAGGRRSSQSLTTEPVRSSTQGFKLGPPKHDRKRALVRFRVTVPSAGELTLKRTAKVRPDHRHTSGPGTVKLTVKPRRHARKRLERQGRVRVRIKVRFTPEAGTPIERERRIRLKSH